MAVNTSFVDLLRDIRDVKYPAIVIKHGEAISAAAAVALQSADVAAAYAILSPHLLAIDAVPVKSAEAAVSAASALSSVAQAQIYAGQAITAFTSLTNEVTLANSARIGSEAARDLSNIYKDTASYWADKTTGEVVAGRYSAKFWADTAQTYSTATVYSAIGVYNFPELVITANGFAYRCIGIAVTGVDPSSDISKWTRVQGGITTASALPFVPNGDLSATNVQDVIAELRDDTDQKLLGKSATSHSHTKADIGLGNVDNTSDALKPLSDASVTALGLKANITDVTASLALKDTINFTKPFQGAPLFTKASVSTITVPIGTSVKVGANIITVSGTAYTLSLNSVAVGALDIGIKTEGTDYYVYALEAGGFILSANATNPTGYTTANSRKIGGFHYGVIPEAFGAINNITASEATGMAGIEKDSFWDLKWMPNNLNNDPRGMRYALGMWVDIYLLNTDHHLYGTSAAGKTIAGGTVLNGRNFPKIPLKFGGDGTTTYGTLTWFEAAEIGKAYGKRLLSYEEFSALAYGVLEATSAGAADTGVTQHLANFTSKFGLCMATGCQWIWSKDLSRGTGATYAWKANTEGRGSIYSDEAGPASALFGGVCDGTVESGSRSSNWGTYVWHTGWGIGARYACDHLELA